jgi:type IV secretory pathway protease TraF
MLRTVGLERFASRGDISILQFLLSIGLPGFALYVLGRKLWGQLFIAAYAIAALVFIAALGYMPGSIAYGLLISIHATSIVFLESIWFGREKFRVRLMVAIGTLLAVWALIYTPFIHFVENHWAMPLRAGKHVIIVHRTAPTELRRGDAVAYQISEARAQSAQRRSLYVREGFGIQRVLALPGDRVAFKPGKLFVNGQPGTAMPYMPTGGEFMVPEKTWFIWPALDIEFRNRGPGADVSEAFKELAMVPETEVIGKAFRSWFWRRQSL